MKKYAVIVAGGSGMRMGSPVPKQFLLLRGKPVLWHTVQAFIQAYNDVQIILVLPGDYITAAHEHLLLDESVIVTAGGHTRFHSVQNGLKLVAANSLVFVHDGVRCLVSPALIRRCGEQAMRLGSAIPAVAATDSLRIERDGKHSVINREQVRMIQTPQTFTSDVLLPAFNQPCSDHFTDEATVVEAFGNRIFLIDGEYDNIKITRPADLVIAERILSERSAL